MTKGGFTPKKWLQKALTTTAAESTVTGAANVRRYITAISMVNTGTTSRIVSIYGWGNTSTNELARITLVANGGTEILTDLPWFVENGESFYFKQDIGNDVNIAVMGIEEVLT